MYRLGCALCEAGRPIWARQRGVDRYKNAYIKKRVHTFYSVHLWLYFVVTPPNPRRGCRLPARPRPPHSLCHLPA